MTSSKRKNKTYTTQFKEETVALVTEQDYTVVEAAEAVEGDLIKSTIGSNGSLTKHLVLD